MDRYLRNYRLVGLPSRGGMSIELLECEFSLHMFDLPSTFVTTLAMNSNTPPNFMLLLLSLLFSIPHQVRPKLLGTKSMPGMGAGVGGIVPHGRRVLRVHAVD